MTGIDRRGEGIRKALAGEQPVKRWIPTEHCTCDLCQGKTPTFARPSAARDAHRAGLLMAAIGCLLLFLVCLFLLVRHG